LKTLIQFSPSTLELCGFSRPFNRFLLNLLDVLNVFHDII